jgi:hypothetical protein
MPSPLLTLPLVHFEQHLLGTGGTGLNVLRLRTTAYAVCDASSAVTAGESLVCRGHPSNHMSDTAATIAAVFIASLPSS